ncbi:metal-dependent hydrolase [Marinomonas aquimarina]|uniref:Metal-dependent hydrolase n=2 Tax=Marinomonas aquimarina TaxID=295068 RepID=A0A1A8TK31_9GAMM|nr:MBL fold metallo-hydrolase [Marinomonas aquimarina]SBS32644.1 metal-dependent hydrolase [Marinomonas aquimarina]
MQRPCFQSERTTPPTAVAHHQQGSFHNVPRTRPNGFMKTLRLYVRFFTEKKVGTVPEHTIPVQSLSRKQLDALPHNDVFIVKLGHSSLLIKHYGEYWLIDPVFSEHASPLSFTGPKRFHPAPISLAELPLIDKVLISHNHYDHLDKATIKQLKRKTYEFYVPKGVDKTLQKWGVMPTNMKVFDWWQEEHSDRQMIAYTPAQHFSGRGLSDAKQTLWGSWVIKSRAGSLFFSGDSGYFPGFKEIGERYGPFTMTFIETGAYDKAWPQIHMTPEQSVQAHLDLQGDIMVPVHNSTFDLAFHPWQEPLVRVEQAAAKSQVTLSTPVFGEVFRGSEVRTKRWWQGKA